MSNRRLKLLPAELLIRTNEVDHADWNYRPLLRHIQRRRFELAFSLIGVKHYDKILEIGYGSGIFMPSLAEVCNTLHGIDVHQYPGEVSSVLLKQGIASTLVSGSASEMPYDDDMFDLVISVSTFEFIEDKRNACREITRVLKKEGQFIVITPAQSKLLDFGFNLLTKEDARKDFGNERQEVIPLLTEYFKILQIKIFPPLAGTIIPVYRALSLAVKK